jgi:non-heme chloroperoxidase
VRFSTTRLSTGPTINYAEHGSPDGQPVLFLHGWPDSSFSFSRVIPFLPERYRVFVLDQRGFGDSERPATGYSIRDFADDAAAFLDAMNIARAAVVGHSFGSFVGRRLAIAHPDRVERLVLIGTGWLGRNEVTTEVQRLMLDLADPVSEQFAREFQASTVYAAVPGDFFDGLVTESLKMPSRIWQAAFDGIMGYEDTSDLARITAPTLLMWGTRDALFSKLDQDRVLGQIRGARLRTYQEIGHCPNWECPEQLAADLRAFIDDRDL